MHPVTSSISPRRIALALALAASILGPAAAETRTGEIGGYGYRLFDPETAAPDSGKPLLVVLHGCRQSAEDMARIGGFDSLAADKGIAVLYPETGPSAGNPYGCWRWWLPEHQVRGSGEPQAIADMVAEAAAAAGVDRERVYVVGFSSGGALSAILGALYPDVFAAAGVHSGMPYAAASTGSCALRAMAAGALEPEARAESAYHARGGRHRVMPLMVIHGQADQVVSKENAGALLRQFARLNDLADDGDGGNRSVDAVADSEQELRSSGGRRYRVRSFLDARGETVLREVMVAGMGHVWSGGRPGEEYSEPEGPDATSLFWEFLSRHTLADSPLATRETERCRDRFGANFSHYWWHGRMSAEEFRCDPWRWSWRRAYDGQWTGGRCP